MEDKGIMTVSGRENFFVINLYCSTEFLNDYLNCISKKVTEIDLLIIGSLVQ